jgi:hypothetical protein
MNQETFDKLDKITNDILECDVCSFHQEMKKLGLPRCWPDATFWNKDSIRNFKVVSIGINPGWEKASEFYTKLKDIIDVEEYKEKSPIVWKEIVANEGVKHPYMTSLVHTFSVLNEQLKIYEEVNTETIRQEGVEKYVFFANLSWCGSQHPGERKFYEEEITCKVYEEEIPNCLDKGYLKGIIETIGPELVIFFGSEALKFYYFTKIFDLTKYDSFDHYKKTQFCAHKRGDKDVYTTIVTAKLKAKEKNTSIIFLPHSCRWTTENKEMALKEVCGWLQD